MGCFNDFSILNKTYNQLIHVLTTTKNYFYLHQPYLLIGRILTAAITFLNKLLFHISLVAYPLKAEILLGINQKFGALSYKSIGPKHLMLEKDKIGYPF